MPEDVSAESNRASSDGNRNRVIVHPSNTTATRQDRLQAEDGSAPPLIPTNVRDTGLNTKFLNALLLKSLYILGFETNRELATYLKLSQALVDQLLFNLKQQGFVDVRGAVSTGVSILRYALTTAGKEFAIDAGKQCEYVGPAPVPLAAFQEQVRRQSLRNERVSLVDLFDGLSELVLPDRLIQRLGPAVNSARALLIYGPPGNGKTTICEAVGRLFKQSIYVPHCVEVAGQVIRVFDHAVHQEVEVPDSDSGKGANLLRPVPDPRWVMCRRPVIIVGGELTLEMLDLQYDRTSRFYEAPPQMKAIGGVCIIDDFGRQRVQPCELLNRWIIPLERGVDYLTIHTGRKFEVPFDEMVLFSTNIPPLRLMDTAQLRRIKYKIRVEPPSMVDFAQIFRRACKKHGLELPENVLKYLMEVFYPEAGISFAGFHPIFFVEHAISACRYRGVAPHLTLELVKDALEDLFVADVSEQDLAAPQLTLVQPG